MSTPIAAAAVRAFRAFQQLSDAEAEIAARRLSLFTLPAGETLFRQGDRGDCAYLLVAGKIAVEADAPGEEDLRLATLESGAVLGEVGLLVDETRTAKVLALEDATLWQIRRADFEAAVEAGEVWAIRFTLSAARDLARRVAVVNSQLVRLIADSKREPQPAAQKVAELDQLRKRLFSEWSF